MRKFSSVINKLWGRGRVRAGASQLPSLIKALRALVSKSVMREVVVSSTDRRQWGVLAAAWVGVSEREFMQAAAREMRSEYEDRVPVPDLTPLGAGARDFLAQLRRAGCSAVLEGGSIARFIAMDPAEVRAVPGYSGEHPVSVAPWSEIARALDAAERLLAEGEANADLVAARATDDMCGKIVGLLIEEAGRHGSGSVEIVTSEDKTRYQFTAQGGKTGIGSIHPEVVSPLLKHLYRIEGSVQKLSGRDVIVRSMGNSSNFRLSWRDAATETPIPRAALPAPECRRETEGSAQLEGVGQAPKLSAETAGASGSQGKAPVLVIDDNPMFCRVLERLLTKEGFDPCFAANGVEALEKLQASAAFRPRVIICDLHMPLMNGKDLLERLKGDPKLSRIPVVMLTSDEDVEAEVALIKGGAEAFLAKSKDPRILSAQIRKLSRSPLWQ